MAIQVQGDEYAVTWTTVMPFVDVSFAPVPEMDTEQKIRMLDEMIEIVEGRREGKAWTKGVAAVAVDPVTLGMCLGGMVYRLSGGPVLSSTIAPYGNPVMRAMGEVIVEQFGERLGLAPGVTIPDVGGAVVAFNDHTSTTREDVVLVLEKTRMKIAEQV